MAPKKTKQTAKQQSADVFEDSISPIRLKSKKSLPSQEETQDEYLAQLVKMFEEESRKKARGNISEAHFEGQKEASADTFDASEEQAEKECLLCCQEDFEKGKYLLSCRHVLCNDCFGYWSAISTQCPACYKESKSILMVLQGSSRVTHISPKYQQQSCQKCKGKHNEEQMYYCDRCQQNCIHVYCHPLLRDEKEGEEWFCQQCSQKKIEERTKSKPKTKETTKNRLYALELAKIEQEDPSRSYPNLRRRSPSSQPLDNTNPLKSSSKMSKLGYRRGRNPKK